MNLFAWRKKVLDVDLTQGAIKIENLSTKFLKDYIGGRGINSRRLFDLVKAGTDPLSSENILLFATGPLNGTLAPGASRFTVTAKSPLTKAFGDSNCGGGFGVELKFAGYDQIVLRGKSARPVYLWIDDDKVEIRDARYLWGNDCWTTEKMIKEEICDPDIEVISIGPAGEKLVRYAAIMNWAKRAAGRTGMGAVMGSKNLKAIAVRGSKDLPVARPDEFERICEEACKSIKAHRSFTNWSEYGTPFLMESVNASGMDCVRNYERAIFEKAAEIGGVRLKADFSRKMRACTSCPVHCSHYFTVADGEFSGESGDGPEYVVTSMIGSKCGISDLPALLKINNLVNKYGIDAGSVGTMIAWSMDCYTRGIINKDITDGLELNWGNYGSAIELIHKIAGRDGFGDILAEGESMAPKIIGRGSHKYMYHIKGMSPVVEDPRATKLFGLQYFTSTRGGDHLRALATLDRMRDEKLAERLFNDPTVANPLVPEGKGKVLPWFENFCAATDSAGLCKRMSFSMFHAVTPDSFRKMLAAATGWDLSEKELFASGERVFNIEKAFNVREGLGRKDDNFSVPEKFLEEPLKEGPAKGHVVELDLMLDEYYEARGWEKSTGLPRVETLKNLGLADIADELHLKR